MKNTHIQEKKQFKKLFKQDNIDRFEDRFKVLETFLQTEQHVTAVELVGLLADNGFELPPEFVKDTLDLMCRYGFAQKNSFDNGLARYEHRHLKDHHDHMICTKCRKIIEFQNEQLEKQQLRIASEYGFHMLQHRMEIYGICADCLKERVSVYPLVTAKLGERLIIKEISGGAGARMRLMTMGLRVGDEIEVITNSGNGQVVVSADFHRYALGRGLAEKILVESAS